MKVLISFFSFFYGTAVQYSTCISSIRPLFKKNPAWNNILALKGIPFVPTTIILTKALRKPSIQVTGSTELKIGAFIYI